MPIFLKSQVASSEVEKDEIIFLLNYNKETNDICGRSRGYFIGDNFLKLKRLGHNKYKTKVKVK